MKTTKSSLPATLLAIALTLFCACEKMSFDNKDQDKVNNDNANLILRVVDDATVPETRAGEAKHWSRLNFAVYQNGKKVKGVNQTEDDTDYGQAAMTLEEGTYQVLVLAHSGSANPTMTTPEKIQFTNAIGFTDTFYHYGNITVTSEPQTHNITLNRVTAMLRFIINDEMPDNVRSMKFYYTGGSGALNAYNGRGCVDSKQTVNIYVDPTTTEKPYTFDLYTIPHETTAKLNLTVTAYDETQTTIIERTFKGVEVQTNKITEFSGDFFTGSASPDDGNGTDDEEPTANSHDTFLISANTAWEGTITKTY